MKIGIPRALLYYKYHHLWENYFSGLGIDILISPETNKEILQRGFQAAIDESCLSSKIFLGHVDWLTEQKCDHILIPRISDFGKTGRVCTKFNAIYDVVNNTFKNKEINFLDYNIENTLSEGEMSAFVRMGKLLGKKKSQCIWAYLTAKQAENAAAMIEEKEIENQIEKKDEKIKVLLVAHRYNILDNYIGKPVIKILKDMNIEPVLADYANKRECLSLYGKITKTIPWQFNKELVGAIEIYKERVDGIILLSTFPCGPDSLVNEIITRRVKTKPVLTILLDDQQGSAGLETRIESFIDIIKFKKADIAGGLTSEQN